MSTDARKQRFVSGDPLRALAALSVLVFHVAFYVVVHQQTDVPISRWGLVYGSVAGRVLMAMDIGLYVFFVLSGYLLTRPFVGWFLGSRDRPSVVAYLRNRFLRIVPAFWVVAAAVVAWFGIADASTGEVLAIFAFVQTYFPSAATAGIDQGWTLDVELAFYVALPITAIVATKLVPPRFRRVSTIVALCVTIFAASLIVRAIGPATNVFYRSFPAMVFAFCPGVVLAAIEPNGRRSWSPAVMPSLVFGAIAAGAVYAFAPASSTYVRLIAAALCSGCIVGALLVRQWRDGTCPKVLDNAPMVWLGRRSYGIYLVHLAVAIEMGAVPKSVSTPWPGLGLGLAATAAVTIAIADVLHRLVERPALRRRATAARAPRGSAGRD